MSEHYLVCFSIGVKTYKSLASLDSFGWITYDSLEFFFYSICTNLGVICSIKRQKKKTLIDKNNTFMYIIFQIIHIISDIIKNHLGMLFFRQLKYQMMN